MSRRAVLPSTDTSKLVVGPSTVMTAAMRPAASKTGAARASMPGKKRLCTAATPSLRTARRRSSRSAAACFESERVVSFDSSAREECGEHQPAGRGQQRQHRTDTRHHGDAARRFPDVHDCCALVRPDRQDNGFVDGGAEVGDMRRRDGDDIDAGERGESHAECFGAQTVISGRLFLFDEVAGDERLEVAVRLAGRQVDRSRQLRQGCLASRAGECAEDGGADLDDVNRLTPSRYLGLDRARGGLGLRHRFRQGQRSLDIHRNQWMRIPLDGLGP